MSAGGPPLPSARRRTRSPYPDATAIIDEAGALTWAETHRRSNALARALRDEGIERATGSRSCAATTATSSRRRWPARSSAPSPSTSTPPSLGRSWPTSWSARAPALIYDQEFAELLSEVPGGLRRYVAWEDEVDEDRRDDRRGADLRRPREDLEPPTSRAATSSSPRGPPERRRAPSAASRRAERARGAVLQDPPALRRDGDDRRAPLPLLGLPALHAQPAHGGHHGAAAAVRSRGHPEGDRGAPCAGTRRRAGDDAADPRPAGRGQAPLRPLLASR